MKKWLCRCGCNQAGVSKAADRLLNFLPFLDKSDPHITLSQAAETDSGHEGHPGLLDQPKSEFRRRRLSRRQGRPTEHRGFRLGHVPADRSQPGDKRVTPFLVDPGRDGHRILGAGKGGNGSQLNWPENPKIQMRFYFGQGGDNMTVAYGVTYPAAGQIKCFGKRINLQADFPGTRSCKETGRAVTVKGEFGICRVMADDDPVPVGVIDDPAEEIWSGRG